MNVSIGGFEPTAPFPAAYRGGFDGQGNIRAQGGRCRGRRRTHPLHAGRRPVPHGPRHVGHERVDRHRRGRSGHDRHRRADGDHPLHPGYGQPHGARRQGGQHHGPQAGLLVGLHHLRLRVADDRAGTQPHGAHHRLVVSRGPRRRIDDAGHRRAGGRRLRARGAAAGLRPRGRRRRDCHRRRPGDRRLHDHLLLVALRIRRRSGHCDRHPLLGAPRGRLTGRASPAPRPDRCRDLGRRAGPLRSGRAQVVGVGLDRAQSRRHVTVRALAHLLVHDRRPFPDLGVLALAAPPRAHRQGTPHRAFAAAHPAARRRPG